MLKLSDKNFKQEVLEAKDLVLVDFYADWCAPCKMLAPTINEVSDEYKGKIKIGKFNIDDSTKIPTQYGIMSIPTLIFFKGGKIKEQITGVISKEDLKKKIEAQF